LPGGIGANDMLIVTNTYTSGAATSSKRLRVNGLNSEYIMRLFDPVNTNATSSGLLYASFTASANFVPATGVGTYFAAFNDLGSPPSATNGFNFRGRVFEIGSTNAYPFTNRLSGLYQFGVANAAGDPAAGGLPSTLFVPVDAVKSVDYQVVLKYDIDNGVAYLWVNPASESDTANMIGPTSDLGAATSLAGLLFRQRTAGGTMDIRDIAVGTTFADVMTNVLANTIVQVATNFNTVTNWPGNPALLEVFATSIGGGPLNYQWYHVAGGVTNAVGANSQTYVVSQLAASDAGNYFCAVTNAGNKGATSVTNFYISVKPDAGLGFILQPVSQFASVGGVLALSCTVTGNGPLTFQWSLNGTALTENAHATGNPGDNSLVTGSTSPNLTISGLSTNETGDYSVAVTTTALVSPNSITSTNAHVVVNPPAPVSIAYLRSLIDTTTFLPTDTASVFAINGVITTFTNITSGTTASYYIQDATAGINLFITGDASFRPTIGDVVSAAGTLSLFSGTLELSVNSLNPYQTYGIVGHTNVMPAPYVFGPFSLTNNYAFMETNMEGRLVMLTNAGFTGSLTLGAASTDLIVTNSSGMTFDIRFNSTIDTDTANKTIAQRRPWTITGVMSQFLSGNNIPNPTTPYTNRTYEINVTRFSDIVTTPPPVTTVTATRSGNNVVLTWPVVPYSTNYAAPGAYSYSVQTATSVLGPYVPLVTGLAFGTATGTYIHTNALLSGPQKFYRVVSP
ncbi:MAG: hypothetical protein QOJ40_586, partial [Verrucomicrobiota bacterium]